MADREADSPQSNSSPLRAPPSESPFHSPSGQSPVTRSPVRQSPLNPRPKKKKQARFEGGSGMSESSASTVTSCSGPFSDAVRNAVRDRYGNKCWLCTTTTPEIAHVIPQEDYSAIEFLAKTGVINFDIRSEYNAVPLCGACHPNYDKALDPGWIFFPTDLQYFIDYEEADFARRCKGAELGIKLERKCPHSKMYLQHQKDTGKVAADARSGWYTILFLRTDFAAAMMAQRSMILLQRDTTGSSQATGIQAHKEWEGAPTGALRRAFVGLGSIHIDMFPVDILEDLRKLQLLYTRNPPEPQNLVASSQGLKRHISNEESNAENTSPSKGLPGPKRQNADSREAACYKNEVPFHQTSWLLGPTSTAADAVERFSYLFDVTVKVSG